jgi:hypothetical protein
MEVENPMAEDMFETARKAFFGTERTIPTPRVSPAEPQKPRNEASAKKVLPQEGSISPAASDQTARESDPETKK